MRIILGSIFIFLINASLCIGQEASTFSEKAISPVNYPIRLSGSFGELRNNHYHTGIDIKGKNSTSGDSIVSIFSGYVSRIRIQSGSYGKCLYVDHPNGLTSVYAHLKTFSPEIEKVITDQQFKYQSAEIDFYPSKDSLKLKQGQFLGYLGNTGRSSGPHLHFECRETVSELPIDPLTFGFGITDSKSPHVQKLIVHELDSNFQVLKRTIKDPNIKSISCHQGPVGIGFKGFDQMDRSSNHNGIAVIKAYANNRLIYHSDFDTLSFYEMKYINASIDYFLKKRDGSTFFMCYKLPSNHIRNIKKVKNNGVIELKKSTNVKIVVEDRSGNKYVSEVNLIPNNKKPSTEDKSRLRSSLKGHKLKFQDLRLDIKPNSYYKPEKIILNQKNEGDHFSLEIGPPNTACHKYYSLRKNDLSKFKRNKDKLRIYHVANNGSLTNLGGHVKNDTFYCRINRFGRFLLKTDSKKIMVKTVSKKPNQNLILRVSNEQSTSGKARDLKINCYVNGTWVPHYYKSLSHLLEISSTYFKPGDQIVVITYDDQDNIQHFKFFV